MPDALKQLGEGPLHLDDLPMVAAELLKQSKGLVVWLFKGEMGAGKTTLIKHVAEQLGVTGTVSSPTFSIVNQYGNKDGELVYHLDLYRLKNELEAFDIGMEEYLHSGHLCLIEWPEKLERLLPSQFFEVHIRLYDSLRRKIYFRRND